MEPNLVETDDGRVFKQNLYWSAEKKRILKDIVVIHPLVPLLQKSLIVLS